MLERFRSNRGFTLMELMVVVAILAILAVVAVPSFLRYMRRAKTAEAVDQIDKMYKGAAVYYGTPRVEKGGGERITCRFPSAQGMTPNVTSMSCCAGASDKDGDNRCDVVQFGAWETEVWSALNFAIHDQTYFGYVYASEGELAAAKFTAAAHGDLDCDGILSTFERHGFGDESATRRECSMKGSSAYYQQDETE